MSIEAINDIIGSTARELEIGLMTMEDSLDFGEMAQLDLVTDIMPVEYELSSFYTALQEAGFHTSYPKAHIQSGLPVTSIILLKGSPVWAALIPMIPIALITGLIAFGITRIEAISKALVPLLCIAFGGVIITAALITRKHVVEAAPALLRRR